MDQKELTSLEMFFAHLEHQYLAGSPSGDRQTQEKTPCPKLQNAKRKKKRTRGI